MVSNEMISDFNGSLDLIDLEFTATRVEVLGYSKEHRKMAVAQLPTATKEMLEKVLQNPVITIAMVFYPLTKIKEYGYILTIQKN